MGIHCSQKYPIVHWSIYRSGRFNVEKDSDVTWTRAWLLSLLLLPCSCWISDPLSEPRMGNGKLKRLFVLGLGLTTLILGQYSLFVEYSDWKRKEKEFFLVRNLFSAFFTAGSILVWYPSPDLSAEQEIVHKIAELSEKLQHANTLNDQRKTDLQVKTLCREKEKETSTLGFQAISKQFTSLIKLVKEHQVNRFSAILENHQKMEIFEFQIFRTSTRTTTHL